MSQLTNKHSFAKRQSSRQLFTSFQSDLLYNIFILTIGTLGHIGARVQGRFSYGIRVNDWSGCCIRVGSRVGLTTEATVR